MSESQDDSEKTEEPSQYRIDEFRRKGQVASSKELVGVLLIGGCVMTLILSSAYMFDIVNEFMEWLYRQNLDKIFLQENILNVFTKSCLTILKMLAPILATAFCISYLSNLFQIGFIFSTESLKFDLTKLSPLSGLKRIFSKKSIFDLFKGLAKFALVISITYVVMKPTMMKIYGFFDAEMSTSLLFSKSIFIKLVFSILSGLFILALVDFAWEKYQYHQKLKMTKQELKDELKQKEGNPEIKQRIKSLQREMSRKRMIEEVKSADVIVTNPTHLSVAISYNQEDMYAPKVVAKGGDHLAFKIREIANEHNIPIVENIPIARALYSTVELGEFVPRNLYKAVAEILAYVYKIRKKRKVIAKRAR